MQKINNWVLIFASLIALVAITYETNATRDSELFISSVTIFLLILWFTFLGACAMGVSKIFR